MPETNPADGAVKILYIRYTRVGAKFHIIHVLPGAENITPALCGHRWGRWATEEWDFRPSAVHNNWCAACLKAESQE